MGTWSARPEQQPRQASEYLVVEYPLPANIARQRGNVGDHDQLSLKNLTIRSFFYVQLANVAKWAEQVLFVHGDPFARASWTILTPALAPMRVAPAAIMASASP